MHWIVIIYISCYYIGVQSAFLLLLNNVNVNVLLYRRALAALHTSLLLVGVQLDCFIFYQNFLIITHFWTIYIQSWA